MVEPKTVSFIDGGTEELTFVSKGNNNIFVPVLLLCQRMCSHETFITD